MDKQQALMVIGASQQDGEELEQWTDLLEEAVFEQCNYFMRRPFLPKLSAARRRRLTELQQAADVLHIIEYLERAEGARPLFDLAAFHGSATPAEVLEQYHAAEAAIKHRLIQTTVPVEGHELYLAWEQLYKAFANAFVETYRSLHGDVAADLTVKMGEAVDYDALSNALKPGAGGGAELYKLYSRLVKILAD